MWPREPPLPWSNYLCLYLWVLHLHNQFILTFIIIQIITKNEKSHTDKTHTQVEPIRVYLSVCAHPVSPISRCHLFIFSGCVPAATKCNVWVWESKANRAEKLKAPPAHSLRAHRLLFLFQSGSHACAGGERATERPER
jgi:hypothetical protein